MGQDYFYLGNENYSSCYNCFYRRTDTNTFVTLKDFNQETKIAYGFSLQRIKNEKVVYNLRSDIIRWDTIKNKWQLRNARERIVDSMGETVHQYDTLVIDMSLKPEELKRDETLKDKLTSSQLKAYIQQEEMRGTEGLNTLKVEHYRRTATPYAVLLLTMIGAVIASRKTRGGSGLHIALGIVIAAFFVLSDRFSTVFSIKGNFPPLIAAWLPNIAFTFVAWFFYRLTPK
jgi:lipopolysaccharide export system permease protein